MAKKLLGYQGLPQIAVAAGASTPNPGRAGVQAWSTTLAAAVIWDGYSWAASTQWYPVSVFNNGTPELLFHGTGEMVTTNVAF